MDHQLVVLKGRSVSPAIKLADGVTTAGRQEDCQLRIKSSDVSRKHCQFFEKNGMLLVKDLGSSNGTFVNGERIQGQRVLEPGDEVMIGKITFRVERIGAPMEGSTKVAPPSRGPGDTAITAGAGAAAGAAAAAAASVPDDEFEIIFDDDPDEAPAPAPAPAAAAAPAPVAAPAPSGGGSLASARKAPAPAAPEPAAAPVPEPEPAADATAEMADDAVADFLMDLKIDEDD